MTKLVETAHGSIEVEVHGKGYPVLILHGSPGGIDAARSMSRFLPSDKFQTILFSRPGYLGTPLTKGKGFDDEADLLIALLDTFQIPRAGVLAWSGGGAPAYRLAVLHPDRITAVVTIAAVSYKYTAPKPSLSQRFLFGTAIGESLLNYASKHAQKDIVGRALEGEGKVRGEKLKKLIQHVMDSPKQRRLVLEIARTMNIGGNRKPGWDNDMVNYAAIDSLQLEQILSPILIIHGEGDTDAVVDYGRFAHKQIQGSQYIEVEDGTHLCFYADPTAEELQRKAMAFLFEHGFS